MKQNLSPQTTEHTKQKLTVTFMTLSGNEMAYSSCLESTRFGSWW